MSKPKKAKDMDQALAALGRLLNAYGIKLDGLPEPMQFRLQLLLLREIPCLHVEPPPGPKKGWDFMKSFGLYRDVEEHLNNGARNVSEACKILAPSWKTNPETLRRMYNEHAKPAAAKLDAGGFIITPKKHSPLIYLLSLDHDSLAACLAAWD